MKFIVEINNIQGWDILITTDFEITDDLEGKISNTIGVDGYINRLKYSVSLCIGRLFNVNDVINNLNVTINNHIKLSDFSGRDIFDLKHILKDAILREDYELANMVNQELKSRGES